MKKIMTVLFATIITMQIQAQGLRSTKSGQVKFEATGGIEEIAAINNQVDVKLLEKNSQIVISMLIKGFKFKNQLMEDHFNENYMESTKLPKADFQGFLKSKAEINYQKDGEYDVTADGNLTIHGVSKVVSQPGKLMVNNGHITIKCNFKVLLKDYNITGLYIGDKIAPEAKIQVNCTL